jgi:hypothetical protein
MGGAMAGTFIPGRSPKRQNGAVLEGFLGFFECSRYIRTRQKGTQASVVGDAPGETLQLSKMTEKVGLFSKFRHKLTSKRNKFDQLTAETE